MIAYAGSFIDIHRLLTQDLAEAPDVHVGEWQAIQANIPQAETIEVEDVSFQVPLVISPEIWAEWVQPNLPWAEEHFQERVSGVPFNPPPSHVRWPYAQKNNAEHVNLGGQFSHTYPERFWPKWVVAKYNTPSSGAYLAQNKGLRYALGDLEDVVRLLKERPGTRQAYLPVWFPEDTGAIDGQRVPCTLGYHFLIRENKLKIVYYIRSCDFYRHFRDDVYMAGRLAQWVAGSIPGVEPDRLVMHISSLHIFAAERGRIEADARSYQEA